MRVRAKVAVHRTDESLAATRELQELLSHGGALPAVWLTAVQSVCVQAGSIDVSLLAAAPSEVPVISRRLPSGPGSDGDVGGHSGDRRRAASPERPRGLAPQATGRASERSRSATDAAPVR